jgi:hypothetical protein
VGRRVAASAATSAASPTGGRCISLPGATLSQGSDGEVGRPHAGTRARLHRLGASTLASPRAASELIWRN